MNVRNMTIDSSELNTLDPDVLTLTCTTNERYTPFLFAFLNSLRSNSPDTQLVARLVNVTRSTYDKLMHEYKTSNVVFIDETVEVDQTRETLLDVAENSTYKQLFERVKHKKCRVGCHDFLSNEAAYCSNIKFNTINHLLRNKFQVIMYLDVDTIIRGDLNHVTQHMQNFDIGMFIDQSEVGKYTTYYGDTYTGFSAGLMVANNTNVTRDFYYIVENRVNENIYNIEADEDEFDMVYKMFEHNVKMRWFGVEYKDQGPEFKSDSLMWSGKSETKAINQQYIDEYEKYLNLNITDK